VVSEAPTRWVHTAGIVGARPDGTVPGDLAEQAATIWDSIAAVLASGGLGLDDIVNVTTYVVHGNDLAPVMAQRDQALGGRRTASTLVVVPALARPEWRVEIAVVACR
jgi:enamine deaminase RidA (YjgF/YER057c/UK114 family)